MDWYPWGEEAFKKSKQENKPIFLSVGYSTCHWCHVMEHESFENVKTAEIMNKHYVNIKVDREERPDVDKLYMHYVQAISMFISTFMSFSSFCYSMESYKAVVVVGQCLFG